MPPSPDQPVVSVVIPCYNQGVWVDEAVDSILAQTFDQFEIIIVNDGSTDVRTNALLAAYNRPRTRVIATTNQGLAAARNNGIRAARGRYILPLDADDRIGPAYLEQAVAHLDNHPQTGIVYCRARLFGAVETDWALPDFSLPAMLVDNVIFCSALFRRADWEATGGYDEGLRTGWEDYDFWLTLIERGCQVHRLPGVHFFYRVAADSMVRARPREHKLAAFSAIYRKHQPLFSAHIEVWIDALLDTRDPYHEARLLPPGGQTDQADSRWCRKVDSGACRLEFPLEPGNGGAFRFQPAAAPVIVGVSGLALVGSAWRTELAWEADADWATEGFHAFLSGIPTIRFTVPAIGTTTDDACRLVIDLDYRAFGTACLPLVAEQWRQGHGGAVPAHQPAPAPPRPRSLIGPWKRMGRLVWQKAKKYGHPAYRLVRTSGLFDAVYYTGQYPDIDPAAMDPLVHYLDTGWREGRNPSALFDNDWYRLTYPETGDGNPLVHYLQTGWRSGCRPGPLFFSDWYLERYRQVIPPGQTPLAHFLGNWRQGFQPSPLFDTVWYLEHHPEVMACGRNPLEHYIESGKATQSNPSPYFDQAYYLEANPTVARDWQVPLRHYIEYGAEEGCRPRRLFDPHFYRAAYLSPQASLLEAFLHFIETGIARDHRPNALFDPAYYRGTYQQADDGEAPLLHYQRVGRGKGHFPCAEVAALEEQPLISILTPVFRTEEDLLRRCIHSVLFQPYPRWELCLVDDGSGDPRLREVLAGFAREDGRIKVRCLEANVGIAGATNAAAELATGDYLAFLDHDDELADGTLYALALAINEQHPDLLYSDEDLINRESRHLDTFYKPGFNRELLLNHNYITHLLVTRRALFRECGGLSPGCDGAQDYDLTLKLSERAGRIVHLPQVLYHWRAHAASTSVNHGEKHYADEAGRRALQAALDRRGIIGRALGTELRFFYRPKREVAADASITVLAGVGIADAALAGLRAETAERWPGAEVLAPEAIGAGQEAAWRNQAADRASGDYLCFLGGAVRPTVRGWLGALVEYGQEQGAGMIGGHLQRPTAAGRHQGSVPDLANGSPRYYASYVQDVSVHHNGIHCPQHVLAVDGGLCLIRRSVFLAAGGYDERFATLDFAQLDLCFRLHRQGLVNVFTPWCVADAAGDSAADFDPAAAGDHDRRLFQERWRSVLQAGDPYHNRQLLLDRGLVLADFLRWYAGEAPGERERPDGEKVRSCRSQSLCLVYD